MRVLYTPDFGTVETAPKKASNLSKNHNMHNHSHFAEEVHKRCQNCADVPILCTAIQAAVRTHRACFIYYFIFLNTFLLALLRALLRFRAPFSFQSSILFFESVIFQLICISPVGRASGRSTSVWGRSFCRARSDSNESS